MAKTIKEEHEMSCDRIALHLDCDGHMNQYIINLNRTKYMYTQAHTSTCTMGEI